MNITYRSRLEESVKKLQPIVEKLTETEIGKVEVIPATDERLDKYFTADTVVNQVRNRAYGRIHNKKKLIMALAIPKEYVDGQINVVAYPTNPLMSLIPTASIEYIAAHELGHLAHTSIRGKEDFAIDAKKLQSETEGIANVIAICAIYSDTDTKLIQNIKSLTSCIMDENFVADQLLAKLDKEDISIREYIESFSTLRPNKISFERSVVAQLEKMGVKKVNGVYIFGK